MSSATAIAALAALALRDVTKAEQGKIRMIKRTLQDAIATIPAEIFRACYIRYFHANTLNTDCAELIAQTMDVKARQGATKAKSG